MAVSDKALLGYFIGGEYSFYFLVKILRGDFLCFVRLEGALGLFSSFTHHLMNKIIADFSACFHTRHPYGNGGAAFALSMIWAQIFPVVAFQFYDADGDETMAEKMKLFLIGCCVLWLLLNIAFFGTIDLKFIATFFSSITAPEYTVKLFKEGKTDAMKFDAAFTNRISFTAPIHGDIKIWVKDNIDRWKLEQKEWFKIELIPDTFLPLEVFKAEGGHSRRRRSSVSFREIVGLQSQSQSQLQIEPQKPAPQNELNGEWRKLAEEVYNTRTSNHKSNFLHINRIFSENTDLFLPLQKCCPKFNVILSFIIEDKFGFRVRPVDWTKDMKDFSEDDCRRIGR